jgi:ribosome biogenesis protein Nip4
MAFDESYGFFEGNLKDAMLRIRKDIQWGSIISWLNDNKVLQLVGTSYNNFEEQKKYAEILKEYLVWRQ